jgi:DNA primase
MAKVSPVSIKYMIHASLVAEGSVEKPDVIGALFGQTEGLLGADLEMRELQKEGKIGRIEVDLERQDKRTIGKIKIPTALDQSETTLIAAAIETIERTGPCDAQIEIEKIEDVRGNKRDYILERAKKLMSQIEGSTDSREISNEIKDAQKIAGVKEYGKSKLACGDISGKELVVVEGRADVLNLIRAGVNNVIGMNGTRLPDEIKELSKEKEITLFVDGDRGGKLIARNVVDNADISYIAVAPDGKEVEELAGKEILMILRKKVSVAEFFKEESRERKTYDRRDSNRDSRQRYSRDEPAVSSEMKNIEIGADEKSKLKKISSEIKNSDKAIILDSKLNELKDVSVKALSRSLERIPEAAVIVMDGIVTGSIIESAERVGVAVIAANNFKTTDTKIKLLSL